MLLNTELFFTNFNVKHYIETSFHYDFYIYFSLYNKNPNSKINIPKTSPFNSRWTPIQKKCFHLKLVLKVMPKIKSPKSGNYQDYECNEVKHGSIHYNGITVKTDTDRLSKTVI